MNDPYAQDRAIAASNLEAELRNERASMMEKLDKILSLLESMPANKKVTAKE